MRKTVLETILEPDQLSVRLQPIFRVFNGVCEIHSLEALIRGPRGTHFERADVLFDYVRRKNAEAAVDRSCFVAICKTVRNLPSDLRINVNVHATTLGQKPGFVDFVKNQAEKHDLALGRLTIEVVEHAPTCNIPELVHSIIGLRDSGVRIALDDVGLGQSNYRMMLDCHPDYFKLDSYFVRGLHVDSKRRAVAGSVVALAKALGSSVVAEGVETREDMAELERMEIEFVQANLLCPAIPLDDLLTSGILGRHAGVPASVTQETDIAQEQSRARDRARLVSAIEESFCL